MKDIKGTKTEKNLMEAFIGECMNVVKYGFFASKAKKDGFVQIQHIFQETASNETEHAKILFKYLYGPMKHTQQNLTDSANNEIYEFDQMYPEFAKIAMEEGFEDISKSFTQIAQIENHHGQRYNRLAKNIQENAVFQKGETTTWICQNCGHIHIGKVAPNECPVCIHPQSYFEKYNENF